jgi:WD40 repeat protein
VLGPLIGHSNWIRSVSFSPDGQRILSGSGDQSLRVWDAKTGETLAVLLAGHGDVLAASFSPDGRQIVSGHSDATVRVWDMSSTLSSVRSFINQNAGTLT